MGKLFLLERVARVTLSTMTAGAGIIFLAHSLVCWATDKEARRNRMYRQERQDRPRD